MEIAEFLLARITEDEAAARAALRKSTYEWSNNAFTEAVKLAQGEGAVEEATDHIARWDPARVLAECGGKRRIVEDVVAEMDGVTNALADAVEASPFSVDYPSRTLLRLLALPYAEHADYQPEWSPLAVS